MIPWASMSTCAAIRMPVSGPQPRQDYLRALLISPQSFLFSSLHQQNIQISSSPFPSPHPFPHPSHIPSIHLHIHLHVSSLLFSLLTQPYSAPPSTTAPVSKYQHTLDEAREGQLPHPHTHRPSFAPSSYDLSMAHNPNNVQYVHSSSTHLRGHHTSRSSTANIKASLTSQRLNHIFKR